tara:strand:+ start:337 stop:777 length:441 start_codon:yes stop_codon:yes gene_type:complete
MPLLHIHLDSNTNEIDLGADLPPQKLILRRVVVARDSTASETTDNSKYGAIVDLHEMFNGTEFVSNLTGSNRLFIPNTPYDGASTHTHKQITTHDFNIRMGAESIPRKFEVRVFDKDNVTLAAFGHSAGEGHYDAIDLYWEYEGKN